MGQIQDFLMGVDDTNRPSNYSLICVKLFYVNPGRALNSAGEIRKALWSRCGSRLPCRSRSGFPPFTPYHVLLSCFY